MRSNFFLGAICAGLLATGYAFTLAPPAAEAAGAKNLKVYPKGTSKKDIKKGMKAISKALGVECDFCHDLSALDKDTPMKEKARDMMRMTMSVNANLKKQGFKQEVTCATCHAGHEKPKK